MTGEIKILHCNSCQRSTKHDLLYSKDKSHSNEYQYYEISYSLAECRGCGDIRLHVFEVSDECDRETDGSIIPNEAVYPPNTLRSRPKWFYKLLFPFNVETGFSNTVVTGLLHEIYIALQNKCPSLATMGIRALLEHVMIEKCGDQKTFAKNIEAFHEAGFISKTQKEAILPVLEAGHAATHRSYRPTDIQVISALDITENIIESIYVISRVGEKAFKDIPGRNT